MRTVKICRINAWLDSHPERDDIEHPVLVRPTGVGRGEAADEGSASYQSCESAPLASRARRSIARC